MMINETTLDHIDYIISVVVDNSQRTGVGSLLTILIFLDLYLGGRAVDMPYRRTKKLQSAEIAILYLMRNELNRF